MPIVYWTPRAIAVAQISSASIDSVDATPANNTFTVTIGGVAISQVGDTDAQTTAVALVAKLQASTHPYFSVITWTAPGAGAIVATADVAGPPFIASLTETGAGSGAVTDFSDDTSATSKHHVNEPLNYSTGALPQAGDRLFVADSTVSMLWELDALSAIALAELRIDKSFTSPARIGLERGGFATSLDAATLDPSGVPEYRAHYFEVDVPLIPYGRDQGVGASQGSSRVKIKNVRAGASKLFVESTSVASDGSRAALRYLAAHADADVEVLSAPGGLSIGADEPGETATIGSVEVLDTSSSSKVIIGEGVTLTSWLQNGGECTLAAAATVASVDVRGGTLDVIGADYTITALTVDGGSVEDRHTKGTGADWTTINVNGGSLDLRGAGETRTCGTLNHNGGTIRVDPDDLTVTTHNLPDLPLAAITVTPA